MSTHPYIPLYVDDYDAATSHLSIAEDGAYGRLLRLCWRTPSCTLPNDMAWIARKIRLSADDFERVGKPVLEEFFILQRGRFVQRRLKREYDDISRKKSARKAAGKKGGEAKARNALGNSPSNAIDLPGDARAFPEPYPEPEPEKKEGAKAPMGVRLEPEPEGFVAFWSEYPRKVGRPVALMAYAKAQRRAGGSTPSLTILAGLRQHLPGWRARPPDKIPHAATWLNRDGWNDEPDSPSLPLLNGHDPSPRHHDRKHAAHVERLEDIDRAMALAVEQSAGLRGSG